MKVKVFLKSKSAKLAGNDTVYGLHFATWDDKVIVHLDGVDVPTSVSHKLGQECFLEMTPVIKKVVH